MKSKAASGKRTGRSWHLSGRHVAAFEGIVSVSDLKAFRAHVGQPAIDVLAKRARSTVDAHVLSGLAALEEHLLKGEGGPSANAVLDIIHGVADAIAKGDDLERAGAPAHWARKRLSLPSQPADAAQDLIERVRERLNELDGPHVLQDPLEAQKLADATAGWMILRGVPIGFGGAPARGAQRRMVDEVRRAARHDSGPKDFALALLRGWGMTPEQAANALRRVKLPRS